MELKLIKIQTDFCDGEVLYHQYGNFSPTDYVNFTHSVLLSFTVHKTVEQVEELRQAKEKSKELKRERRQQLYESLVAKGKPIPDDLEKEFGEGAKNGGEDSEGSEGDDDDEEEEEEEEEEGGSFSKKRKSAVLEKSKKGGGKVVGGTKPPFAMQKGRGPAPKKMRTEHN